MIWTVLGRLRPLYLALLAFSIVFISIALCAGALGLHFHSQHLSSRHENLKTLAKYAASLINPKKHQWLTLNPDQDSLYQELLLPLVHLHSQLPKVNYLYTMTIINGRKYFVLDTSNSPIINKHNLLTPSAILEEYTDYSESPDWIDSLVKGQLHIDSEPVEDEFGQWITISVPVHSAQGELIFWLGMDFNASGFIKEDQEVILDIVVTLTIGAFIALGVAVRSRMIK